MGIAGALALGIVLALGAGGLADSVLQAGREAYLAAVATEADAAFEELESQLDAALDAARHGAALILDGDQPPQDPLGQAADLLESAGAAAADANAAAARLRGTLVAVHPRSETSIPDLPTGADLASIAAQLRAAADTADAFLLRRHAAEDTLAELERALAALDARDLGAALGALDAAAEARSVLLDWEEPPSTLELWLETTGAMINAAQEIVDAAMAGDEAAVRRAADAYAAAAVEAQRADVSLALSLSETAAGLTNTPLRRLADALAAVEQVRAGAASLRPQ
jgi:hypothetical protein